MKNSFLIYNDYNEFFKLLTDEQLGIILRGMMQYSLDKTIMEMPVEIKITFIQIRQQMDRNEIKYEEICRRNQINGLKGGRPKTQHNPLGYLATQQNPEEPRKPDKDKDKDKDTNNTNGNKFLTRWNEVFKTKFRATEPIKDNLTYWLKSYSLEEILNSIPNIKQDKYWMDKDVGPEWLLRTRDSTGPVDRIGKMLGNTKNNQTITL